MPGIFDMWFGVQVMYKDAEDYVNAATADNPQARQYFCADNIGDGMSTPLHVRPTFFTRDRKDPAPEPVRPKQFDDPDLLAELVSRMMAFRSRRWSYNELRIMPMRQDWWEHASKAYPSIETAWELPAAWGDLVIATTKWISEAETGWVWTDLTEKLGKARLSARGLEQDLSFEIVSAAEHLSNFVCFMCGAPAQPRHDHTTLCLKHHTDRSWRTTGHE